MKKLLATLALLMASTAQADTPPQVINKTCSTNQFFNKIAPGAGNITCLQPSYSGILNTPNFIDSLTLVSGNVLLSGDAASPGNSQYYGTNSLGFKGYYSLPSTGVAWGAITGTLSNQTDLQSALDAKQVAGNYITALSSDVTATGPGVATSTVNSVGGSTASAVNSATVLANNATNLNTASQIVKRDGSGNFSAGTITGSLTGHASLDLPLTGGTLTGTIFATNLSGTNTGDVTLGTASGLSLVNQVLSLALSSTSTTGALSSADWNTFNGKQSALTLGDLTDVGTDGITIGSGTGAVVGSGTTISQHVSDTTHAGYLSSADWNTFNSKAVSGNYLTALTGDGTAAGPGSAAFTLATVNVTTGSFGSSTSTPNFVVNGKGLITAAASTSIQIAESQVTNLVSDLAGKQPTGNYITALSSDVVATGPGAVAATIQSNVVSNSKLAQMGANTVKANITGSTANASDASLGTVTESTSSVLTLTGWSDATIGSPTILVKQSSTSQSGYLSSTDWTTFNGKQSALTIGNLTDAGTDGIIVTSGTGAVIGSGTSVAQHVSDATHNGYLSSTDWSTFNSKQPAGSYITASSADTLSNKTISGASNTLSNIADGSLSTSYLKADGTRALTGNWAAGAFLTAFGGGSTISSALVGATPSAAQNPMTGANQRGFRSTFVANSSGTGNVAGFSSAPSTAGASGLRAYFEADTVAIGAGSATRDVNYYMNGVAAGGTNNAGIADNITFTGNWGINLSSTNPNLLTGATAIGGTATNNNAATGFVGEYVESVISSTTSIPGTTGQYGNLTSISLTAGDWETNGLMSLDNANAASITTFAGAISVNSGNTTTDQVDGSNQADSATPGATAIRSISIPAYRLSLSTTTTVYLKMAVGFTVATPQYRCRLSARRMR